MVGIFAYASFLVVHYFKNRDRKILKIFFNGYFWSANFLFVLIYIIVYFLNTYGFIQYLGGLIPNGANMLNLSETFGPLVDRASFSAARGSTTVSKSLVYYLSALWQSEPLLLIGALFGSFILFIKYGLSNGSFEANSFSNRGKSPIFCPATINLLPLS